MSTGITEKLVADYLELVQKINSGEDLKIKSLFGESSRQESETFEEYKERRKAENLVKKHYLKGVRFQNKLN